MLFVCLSLISSYLRFVYACEVPKMIGEFLFVNMLSYETGCSTLARQNI
jgi:hypothetical protein